MAEPALRVVGKDEMDKQKALEAALSQIERAFGKGSVMKLGQNDTVVDVEAIPTGSLGLDIALGIGGVPRGRVVEIYGTESSGKTTLALHMIAEAQKLGGTCAFVDAEHALDPGYAKKLGVDIDELLISQPDAGEQALEITDTLVRSRCTVIFINQIRMKIGVMFGSPETTSGGQALKFYASVRLDIRRIGAIKDRDEIVGNQTRVKVVKNKLAPPFRIVEFDIMYGEGVSKVGEILDLGVKAGVVEKSGSWFSFDSQRIGQGRENAKQFLKDNPDVAGTIERSIRQDAGLNAEAAFAAPDPAETAANEG